MAIFSALPPLFLLALGSINRMAEFTKAGENWLLFS